MFFQPHLVKSFGYPIEEHFVKTEDGYILTLHRIPYGLNENTSNTEKPAILLAPCLISSSAIYTLGPTENSLAYILADAGSLN